MGDLTTLRENPDKSSHVTFSWHFVGPPNIAQSTTLLTISAFPRLHSVANSFSNILIAPSVIFLVTSQSLTGMYTDIDLLIENEGATKELFDDLMSEICFNGCSFNHIAGLEFAAGHVKQPRRTLEKLVR